MHRFLYTDTFYTPFGDLFHIIVSLKIANGAIANLTYANAIALVSGVNEVYDSMYMSCALKCALMGGCLLFFR